MIIENFDITIDKINACNDRGELIKMKQDIEGVMVSVKSQIAKAKARIFDGEEIDNEWYSRVKSFKHSISYMHQRILFKESEMKRAINKENQNLIGNIFMDVARETLSSETFNEILYKSQNRQKLKS